MSEKNPSALERVMSTCSSLTDRVGELELPGGMDAAKFPRERITAALTRSPGSIPKHLAELRSTLDVLILPERRSQRRYPRHVKIKMSNYKRNRGKRNFNPTQEIDVKEEMA